MSFPRLIIFGSAAVFFMIGTVALVKKSRREKIEVSSAKSENEKQLRHDRKTTLGSNLEKQTPLLSVSPVLTVTKPGEKKADFPEIDRLYQLFTTGPTKLPIVDTVVYSSSVPWLKGRPAWISDYAVYYATSRHFIARSLNGKPDYFSQKASPGSCFNVFRKDKRFQFHLLADLSRCKMGLYYVDLDTNERVHLKTYTIGIGKIDSKQLSGSLTPVGVYSLGSKVAIYQPGTMGVFQDRQVEMIRIFGTRWIPFEKELGPCSAPAKGYGFRGAPWEEDRESGQLVENREGIGKCASDGSIYLAREDIEELFAIVITKPTVVEIVKDFYEAKLPGVEVATPRRLY